MPAWSSQFSWSTKKTQMNCIQEAISLKWKKSESSEALLRRKEVERRGFHRQTMTYSGVNITMINYCFPKKQNIQHAGRWRRDDWWSLMNTLMSINWILEQKLRSREQINWTIDEAEIQFGSSQFSFILVFFAVCPKTIFNNWRFRSQEQCSTNLNSPVILIMLVSFFLLVDAPIRKVVVHWWNNREILHTRSKQKSAKSTSTRFFFVRCETFFWQRRQFPFQSPIEIHEWNSVGHLKTGSFLLLRSDLDNKFISNRDDQREEKNQSLFFS